MRWIDADAEVHLVLSPYGRRLLADELDIRNATVESLLGRPSDRPIHSATSALCVRRAGAAH
jgi:hypothetical protein